MESTDFNNLKQQNGLDSSCKATLSPSIWVSKSPKNFCLSQLFVHMF
jgi:hypothetical protein